MYFYSYTQTFNEYLCSLINDYCIVIPYHWIILISDIANFKDNCHDAIILLISSASCAVSCDFDSQPRQTFMR